MSSFLARRNITDYSYDIELPSHLSSPLLTRITRPLLSIDEERKQIHCPLVDIFGSYTFAETLEYKAKGLSGKGERHHCYTASRIPGAFCVGKICGPSPLIRSRLR